MIEFLKTNNDPIATLCTYIDRSPTLSRSQILASCTFVERRAPVAPHRCVAVELQLPPNEGDYQTIWLLLERMPTSKGALVRGLGRTPSNDQGRFGDNLYDLVDRRRYKFENKQEFRSTIMTLGEVRHILGAMSREMPKYNLFLLNCWVFCSILQEQLGWGNADIVLHGAYRYRNFARAKRKEIDRHKQRVYHIADPLTLPIVLRVLADDTNLGLPQPSLSKAMTLYDRWAGIDDATSVTRIRLTPKLASSVNDLAQYLRDNRLFNEAASLSSQLVATFRRAAESAPSLYQDHLATSLHWYGFPLSDAARRAAALSAHEEALAIKQHLFSDNPSEHSGDIDHYYHNHSFAAYSLGRLEDAISSDVGAVQLARNHLTRNPSDTDRARVLAWRLCDLCRSLVDIGRFEDAASAADDVVQLCGRLSRVISWSSGQDIAQVVGEIAHCLSDIGSRYGDMGKSDLACSCVSDAVNLLRKLNYHSKNAQLPALAHTLGNYANVLRCAGRSEEALDISVESLRVWTDVSRPNPEPHIPLVAVVHNTQGWVLHSLSRDAQAEFAAKEAMAIRRQLLVAERENQAYPKELADSLTLFGNLLRRLGRHDEALAAFDEAVTIERKVYEANPSTRLRGHLAYALMCEANALANGGQCDRACKSACESVELTRINHTLSPTIYANDLGCRLAAYGRILLQSDETQYAHGASVMEEACHLLKNEYKLEPTMQRANDLLSFFETLWTSHAKAGRYAQAYSVIINAVQLASPLQVPQNDTVAKNAAGLAETGTHLYGAIEEQVASVVGLEAVIAWRYILINRAMREIFISALVCLSTILRASLDVDTDSIATIEGEAVWHFRQLQTSPSGGNMSPDFATRLFDYGQFLYHLGRHENAMTVFEEVASIQRRSLHTSNPTGPGAAVSLQQALVKTLSHLLWSVRAVDRVYQAVVIEAELAALAVDRL